MSSIPELLREVHRLRKHIRDTQAEIERGPRVLKAHQTKLQKQEDNLKQAQEEIKKLKVTIHDRETSLKSTNQQLAKYEKQLGEASNQKEYEAFQHEIQHTEGIRTQLEEEILNLMMELEEKTAKIPELDKQLQQAKQDFVVYQKDAAERMERLKVEGKTAETELAGVEVNIPENIREQFKRLIKSFGADAFAGVKDRTCQQCHTTITIQNQTELEQGHFLCCRSCGRGLYLI